MVNNRKRKTRPLLNRRKTAVPKAVKMYVKRTIKGACENKQAYTAGQSQITGYNVSTSLLAVPIHPDPAFLTIAQNVGSADRIGNKIRLVKAVFNYILTPMVYNASLNPLPAPNLVKLWFGYNKTTPLTRAPANPLFLQSGNTSGPCSGFLGDVMRPVNKDLYKIYRQRVHKVGHSADNGTGGSASNSYQANNDFKMCVTQKINVTKYMHKNILFNDTTNSQTNGHGLYVYITSVRADGTSNSVQPIFLDWWVDFYYEDA